MYEGEIDIMDLGYGFFKVAFKYKDHLGLATSKPKFSHNEEVGTKVPIGNC